MYEILKMIGCKSYNPSCFYEMLSKFSPMNMFSMYEDVFNICRITSQIAKQKVSTMMSIPDIDCTLSEYSITQQRRLNGTYNLLFLF